MASPLGIRIVRPVTLRKFFPTDCDTTDPSSVRSDVAPNERVRFTRVSKSATKKKVPRRHSTPFPTRQATSHTSTAPGVNAAAAIAEAEGQCAQIHTDSEYETADDCVQSLSGSTDEKIAAEMPASVAVANHSSHRNFANFDLNPAKSPSFEAGGAPLAKPPAIKGINHSGFAINGEDLNHPRSGFIGETESGRSSVGVRGETGGGMRCAPVANQKGSSTDGSISSADLSSPYSFGPKLDNYKNGVKMTRAVPKKPAGIGESLAWLKRELMDLRNTDKELERTLTTLQTKIRDLKSKLNQDEAEYDDDDSEKTEPSTTFSSPSSTPWNGSFSGSAPISKVINVITEESEDDSLMEVKKIKLDIREEIKITRTSQNMNAVNSSVLKVSDAVNGSIVNGTTAVNGTTVVNGTDINGTTAVSDQWVNGDAVNHNANGYSRNTNNSLNQRNQPLRSSTGSRKSITSDGSRNSNVYEKPNLPPPPPPPTAASPTPSLKSTSSSDVLRFGLKEESKRDSMSSSSFVSSSSSFTSSLEELRLQDVTRDLRSSGRSFDRMTFDEEEEEEETIRNEDNIKKGNIDNDKDADSAIDDNGNGKDDDETTEAARWMDSIWEEVTMLS